MSESFAYCNSITANGSNTIINRNRYNQLIKVFSDYCVIAEHFVCEANGQSTRFLIKYPSQILATGAEAAVVSSFSPSIATVFASHFDFLL